MRGWRNPPQAGKLADLPASGGRTTIMVSIYVISVAKGFRYVGMTSNLKGYGGTTEEQLPVQNLTDPFVLSMRKNSRTMPKQEIEKSSLKAVLDENF